MRRSTLSGWKQFGNYRKTASGLWQGDCLHCGFVISGSHTRFAGHFNPDDKATKTCTKASRSCLEMSTAVDLLLSPAMAQPTMKEKQVRAALSCIA